MVQTKPKRMYGNVYVNILGNLFLINSIVKKQGKVAALEKEIQGKKKN